MKSWFQQLRHVLGVPPHSPSFREQAAAVATSILGLALVASGSALLAPTSSPWLLTSMGATAVLVFALPHGPLSQPWAVLAGHLLSAAVALAILQFAGSGIVQSAVAVGLSIAAMHLTRCIHPPGGATALYIVQSASAGTMPQWSWLLWPVLGNVAVILLAAVALNYPFPWRRYPAALAFHLATQEPTPAQHVPFSAQELAQAMDDLDLLIDISDEQLQLLYEAILDKQRRLPHADT